MIIGIQSDTKLKVKICSIHFSSGVFTNKLLLSVVDAHRAIYRLDKLKWEMFLLFFFSIWNIVENANCNQEILVIQPQILNGLPFDSKWVFMKLNIGRRKLFELYIDYFRLKRMRKKKLVLNNNFTTLKECLSAVLFSSSLKWFAVVQIRWFEYNETRSIFFLLWCICNLFTKISLFCRKLTNFPSWHSGLWKDFFIFFCSFREANYSKVHKFALNSKYSNFFFSSFFSNFFIQTVCGNSILFFSFWIEFLSNKLQSLLFTNKWKPNRCFCFLHFFVPFPCGIEFVPQTIMIWLKLLANG